MLFNDPDGLLAKLAWNTSSDYLSRNATRILDGTQSLLDVVGLVPGVGEVADGANALIYLGRGDNTNAALSGAAMIPFVGWGATTAKVAGKVDNAVDGLGFTRSQLQHAFKHSKDFGVTGNANNKTLAEFSSALQSHVDAAGTRAIQGTYRGNPVTHHVDPSTGLNVIRDSSGNFLSGWKLSPQQLEHVLTTGKLGGGR